MIYIIVEGQTDKAFINNLLNDKKENNDYKFLGLEGYDKVVKTIEKLTKKDLQENRYFAIVDADENFETRKCKFEEYCKKELVGFFIFPDNQTNGDLETLLLSKIDKNNNIIRCFDDYNICINKAIDKKVDNKAKMYAYTTLEHNKKPEKYIKTLDMENDFSSLKEKLKNLFDINRTNNTGQY